MHPTSPYAIPAKRPAAPGMAVISRYTSHYRRTVNGAWIGNGGTEEFFEVPLDKVPDFLACGSASCTATFEDGSSVSVDGANTPARGYGWNGLGYIQVTDMWGTPRRELVQLNPHLPTAALCYYGVRTFTPEQIATFEPLPPRE